MLLREGDGARSRQPRYVRVPLAPLEVGGATMWAEADLDSKCARVVFHVDNLDALHRFLDLYAAQNEAPVTKLEQAAGRCRFEGQAVRRHVVRYDKIMSP